MNIDIYDNDNVFAKILINQLPCNKIYEDQFIMAFHDLHPAAPVHAIVIPKGQFISFSDFIKNAHDEFVINFFSSLQKVIEILDIEKSGYRMISNCGNDGIQTIPHFHVHLLGKKMLGPIIVDDIYHSQINS